jgi:hypothetical protein
MILSLITIIRAGDDIYGIKLFVFSMFNGLMHFKYFSI